MKVTNNQIDALYLFTRKHYVEHFDVQTELVDHLANAIENIWQEQPNLTFEQARDVSFKKFGVFGFMNVVEEKQKFLGKKYKSILWKYAKEWFALPKIALTLTAVFFFYYVTQIQIGMYLISGLLLLFVLANIYYAQKLTREFKKRIQTYGKKWMLEEMIFNVASFGGIIIASNIPQIINSIEKTPSKTAACLIAVLLTAAMIYSYITLIIIPKKAEKLLREQYPEYQLCD